jgi:hypothetical protein
MNASVPRLADPSAVDGVPLPGSIATPGLDLRQQFEMAEVSAVARCPVCRAPVVFRMSCTGPKVQCLCAESGVR